MTESRNYDIISRYFNVYHYIHSRFEIKLGVEIREYKKIDIQKIYFFLSKIDRFI